MLATSTHDSKRSEDVRARLNVLSEIPKEWTSEVLKWRRANQRKKRALADGRTAPDPNEEYFLYQTLVGAWPLTMESGADREDFIRRIQEYMTKALNEAKVNMSWTTPNPEYQQAVEGFIARILTPSSKEHSFWQAIQSFLPRVMYFGALNSLAQLVLKLTCPGVPDLYRGTELWDLSLVDPDNRRPVNYDVRQQLLSDLRVRELSGDLLQLCAGLLENWKDGRIKMWTAMRILRFRRDHGELFQHGSYEPLTTEGEPEQHVIAFARRWKDQAVMVAVPRFTSSMEGDPYPPIGEAVWQDNSIGIPGVMGEAENVLTGETIRLRDSRLLCRELFRSFPVAVLNA